MMAAAVRESVKNRCKRARMSGGLCLLRFVALGRAARDTMHKFLLMPRYARISYDD